jgi:hypothetical protein
MSRKKAPSPADALAEALGRRPAGSRCTLVLDPDGIADIGRTVTDDTGRQWEAVIYRGDDVVTRRAWARAWGSGRPLALVLSRPEGDESVLDASSIADLAGHAEGETIDLSLLGYFRRLFPRLSPPVAALKEYRRSFLENVEAVVKAYPRFKERWGEPDVWGRGHFLAILLVARFPALTLNDLWCAEADSAAFAAHAVWLLCHPTVAAADLPAVAAVVWESAGGAADKDACAWLRVPAADLEAFRGEVAGYLVVRDLLAAAAPQHLDALLKVKLAPSTFDPETAGPQAAALTAVLKEVWHWSHVQERARDFLTPDRLQRTAELFQHDGELLVRLAGSASTAPVMLAYLARQALLERCQGGAWPEWVARLGEQPLLAAYERGEPLEAAQRSGAALLSAARQLDAVERALAEPPPAFADPEALLDWYVGHGRHLLEYRTADAFAKLELVDDAALQSAGYTFIMESPRGLRYRVRHYLNGLDGQLATFVRADVNKFQQGRRSAIRIIPDVVRGGGRARNRRVWVLVMDGMRYDTWEAVVRPLLMEHFEVVDGQDKPYFSLLPSKTDIARRGLLAGAMGRDWKDGAGRPTKDERKLAARVLGVLPQHVNDRVLFVTDAETTQARQKMGYVPGQAHDVNVLIYPISDDLGHHHNDTLAALNDKIRQQLVTQQGMRGIVDDLRRRVQQGDLVLVTSDHGFQELYPQDAVLISAGAANQRGRGEEDVAYRHLRFSPGKDWSIGDHVVVTWEELANDGKKQETKFTLPVGGTWYQRERGKPARFAHGGISLAEMTIPAVLLQPIVEKASRVEFLDLAADLLVHEDETASLEFELANRGNVATAYEVVVETNLGERLLDKKGTLASGKGEKLACRVAGRYQTDLDRNPLPAGTLTAIFLKMGHAGLDGTMNWPPYGRQTVQVQVKPRPTKIDTDALKAFDNL